MHWNGEEHAGFSITNPWLPVADDYRTTNVVRQQARPGSLLNFYRRAIALRRREPALNVGAFALVLVDGNCFTYLRRQDGRAFLVALNLGSEPVQVDLSGHGRVALDTHLTREGEYVRDFVGLQPDQGLVISLEKDVAHG